MVTGYDTNNWQQELNSDSSDFSYITMTEEKCWIESESQATVSQ